MRVLLLGPQGAGKGTQAQRLALLTGARHISTGDLVRREIASGSELGHVIAAYNNRGELVPDETMIGMAMPSLIANESWILDGFPRTIGQVYSLDAALQRNGLRLDATVFLEAPDEQLIARLAGRRHSLATGRTYHLTYDPPSSADPGPFIQRDDDTPSSIRRRLSLYRREMNPIAQYYALDNLAIIVDALQPIETITGVLLQTLDEKAEPRVEGAFVRASYVEAS